MKTKFTILLLSLALSACATQPRSTLQQQLAGKGKQERISILIAACEQEFSTSHVTRDNSVKYGKNRYRPHTKEKKAVCAAMGRAVNGSRNVSSVELLRQCLNEQVIGGRINKSPNQKHIERVNAICRAFRAEM